MNLNQMGHFLTSLLGVLLGVSIYAFINLSMQNTELEFVLSGLLGIIIAYMVKISSRFLDRVVSWRDNTGVRLILGFCTHLCIALAFSVLGKWIYKGSVIVHENWIIKLFILLVILSLLYNIIYFIFYSYHNYAHGQVEKKRLARLQQELQLTVLKSQLSPHFLFNSLNALATLFHKDIELANTFIRNLAESFRYVLDNYDRKLVSLKNEIGFVKDYTDMIRIRFGECLEVRYDGLENISESGIPPLTIQMLVENAVKHNNMDSENPLSIHVFKEANHINVVNKKNLRNRDRNTTSVGLANISKRYELLCGRSIKVEESDYFTVRLPIII